MTFLLDLDLTNKRLWPVHNIQAYFGKFSVTEVSKILTFGKLFKVKVKAIIGAAFHKLNYEPNLKYLCSLFTSTFQNGITSRS